MSKSNNLHDFVKDIADTIRDKKGYPSTQLINPQDFSDEIDTMSGDQPSLPAPTVIGGFRHIRWQQSADIPTPTPSEWGITTVAKLDGVILSITEMDVTQADEGKILEITTSGNGFQSGVTTVQLHYMDAIDSSMFITSGGVQGKTYGLMAEMSDETILNPTSYHTKSGSKYYSEQINVDSAGAGSSTALSLSFSALSSAHPETFKISFVRETSVQNSEVTWTICVKKPDSDTPIEYEYTGEGKTFVVPNEVSWDFQDEIFIIAHVVALPGGDVYGVSWVNDSSTTMTRTDNAIGLSNPTFAEITGSGGYYGCDSPFDNLFPWNQAAVEIINGNKMLHMPEMYFRITVDNTDTSNPKITGVAVSEAEGDPLPNSAWYHVDEFWYGCYGASSDGTKLQSVSGVARKDNLTRFDFNTQAKANNTDPSVIEWHQLDLYHHTVMLFLWMIEFARKDTNNIANGNFRGVISGSGTSGGTGYVNTGLTDPLNTYSIQTGWEPTRRQMRWHYIEDFVGNKWEWVDGIIHAAANASPSATSDPSKFTNSASDMSVMSYHNPATSGQDIRAFGWDSSHPFLCMPNDSSGTGSNTGFCNAAVFSAGFVLYVGADATYSSASNGVFYFSSYGTSYTYANVGGRLLKRKVS